jgi:hypothetical protein
MIIFAGDYVKTKADGAWHLVRNTDGGMLILLDNGFLAYADDSHIEQCLSANQYAAQNQKDNLSEALDNWYAYKDCDEEYVSEALGAGYKYRDYAGQGEG